MADNIQPAGAVRVRFAPSPTGYLHVGNIRTCLYNWLVARHHGGSLILRIEDTDPERSSPLYEKQILEDLLWLGLRWDEGPDRPGPCGPYRQSDRHELYRMQAERLFDRDRAYRCFCPEEVLEEERRQQLAGGEMPLYSGRCRHLLRSEVEARLRAGEDSTLRLRVRPGTVGFDDLVYGRIDVETSQISDPVLLRSDGSPTYNFSCVVDDVQMRITHVIRGEGHLSNTHRQILIYEAMAAPLPQIAHLSTILGPDGQKLSKRHGATSVEELKSQGYLPEALMNYLALLGWSPAEEGREIFPLEEIARLFELSRVSKSPAIFDRAKLDWMNRSYIGMMAAETLAERAERYFVDAGLVPPQPDPAVRRWLSQLIDAVRTHADRLDQLPREAEAILGLAPDHSVVDDGARDILREPAALSVARRFAGLVEEREILTLEAYREIVGLVKTSTGQKGRSLFHPIRAALTGRGSGPELDRLIPIFEEGSRLKLPRPVLGCRERLRAVLRAVEPGQ
jgi:nondiscriminating glutamyl-tRNA synthetase